MQITSFTPANGQQGTNVTINVTQAPPDATADNTDVLLSGSPMVTVTAVAVDDTGDGTINVTIEPNAQSGDFVVLVQSPTFGLVDAQTGTAFTVATPQGQPVITNASPTTVQPGQTIRLNGRFLNEIDQSVSIGTVQVAAYQRVSPALITFVVPAMVPNGLQRIAGWSHQFGRVNCPLPVTVVGAQQAAA